MKTITITSLSLFMIYFLSCKTAKDQNSHAQYSEENHPVRALYLTSIEALNEGKLDVFLANFATDIKMYGTDGIYVGEEALRKRFDTILRQFPNMRMGIPELDLEILSENVVMVNFKWKVYPMGQGPAFSGVGSGIYKLLDGKWVEILEAETITEVDDALKQE